MADKYELKAVISAKSDGMVGALKQVQTVAKTTRKYLLDVARSAGKFNGKVGLPATIGFAGVAFAASRAANAAVEYASSIQDATDRTGASAEGFQMMSNMLGQVGGSSEDAETAIKKFGKGIATAAAGGNKGFAGLMARMGISMKDASGQVKSLDQVMPDLADAFQRNTNPAVRTRMAIELFGKSGTKLIPILAQGKAAMIAWNQEQVRLGAVVSKESIGAVDDLGDSMEMLHTQIKSQLTQAMAQLVPVLMPIIKGMQEWIANNKEWLRSQVTTAVRSFAEGLAQIDFKAVIEGARKFFGAVSNLVGMVGGASNALMILVGIMAAPMIAATLGLIGSVARLVWWFGTLAWTATASVVPAVIRVTGSLIAMSSTAIPSAIAGMGSLKVAMETAGMSGAGLLGVLGKLSGVAAAGFAGYQIGTWLNNNVVNPGMAAMTGQQDQTLGGWIYDKTHPTDLTGGGKVNASGSIDININGAPAGTRVEQVKAGGDVPIRTNVGYRSLALGL